MQEIMCTIKPSVYAKGHVCCVKPRSEVNVSRKRLHLQSVVVIRGIFHLVFRLILPRHVTGCESAALSKRGHGQKRPSALET